MLDTVRQVPQAVIDYNKKVRLSNLCRECFADDTYSFETRLDSFAMAYDLWREGSFERDTLIRQYPLLVNMLRMNRAPVSSQ